jgi:hypothetical protein
LKLADGTEVALNDPLLQLRAQSIPLSPHLSLARTVRKYRAKTIDDNLTPKVFVMAPFNIERRPRGVLSAIGEPNEFGLALSEAEQVEQFGGQ